MRVGVWELLLLDEERLEEGLECCRCVCRCSAPCPPPRGGNRHGSERGALLVVTWYSFLRDPSRRRRRPGVSSIALEVTASTPPVKYPPTRFSVPLMPPLSVRPGTGFRLGWLE